MYSAPQELSSPAPHLGCLLLDVLRACWEHEQLFLRGKEGGPALGFALLNPPSREGSACAQTDLAQEVRLSHWGDNASQQEGQGTEGLILPGR